MVWDTLSVGNTYKSNADSTKVPCKASEETSTGTDSFEWICDERIAANNIEISSASATADLAEVVIVGFLWGKCCHDNNAFSGTRGVSRMFQQNV